MTSQAPAAHWPLFGLRVRADAIELRYPSDDDIAGLADLAAKGIHDPAEMPFAIPWTRRSSPELEQGIFRHHWECRTGFRPEKWKIVLAVVHDGEIVGSQSMRATDFEVCRTVETGSWLGRSSQGKGFGKAMRACALGLAFAGLGAEHAISDVYHDNHASLGLNRRFGYEENWGGVDSVEGKPRPFQRFHLDRRLWEANVKELFDVRIQGLQPCLSMFGASGATVEGQ